MRVQPVVFLLFLTLGFSSTARPASADQPGWKKLDATLSKLAENPLPSETEKKLYTDRLGELKKQFAEQPITYYWMGETNFRNEKYPQARADWKAGWEANTEPKTPTDRDIALRLALRLGQLALQENKLPLALKWADHAMKLAPKKVAGYQLAVQGYIRTGEIINKRPFIEDAAQKYGKEHPGFDKLLLSLDTDLGQNELVLKHAQKVLDRDQLSPVAHYFLADQAKRKGDDASATWHALVAVHNGSANDPMTQQAAKIADSLLSNAERNGKGTYKNLSIGYQLCSRADLAKEALDWLAKAKPSDPWATLIYQHAQATAHTESGDLEKAKPIWEEILKKYPNNIPALVGLGEIIENEGKIDEAAKLFQKAAQRVPANGRVRQITRLGGTLALTEKGVKVVSVQPDGPLAQFGLAAGDELLAFDEQQLADLKPFLRLRAARLFQGGIFTYKDKTGKKQTKEVDLILFPY